jgi:hypothetical protein
VTAVIAVIAVVVAAVDAVVVAAVDAVVVATVVLVTVSAARMRSTLEVVIGSIFGSNPRL